MEICNMNNRVLVIIDGCSKEMSMSECCHSFDKTEEEIVKYIDSGESISPIDNIFVDWVI